MKGLAILTMTLAAGAAQAAEPIRVHDLTITGAVMRAPPPGVSTTAGYLAIANAGAKADKLVSASCACAGMVMMHATVMNMGRASMTSPGEIVIPAHGEARLAPGGYHLMIMGLKAAAKDGSTQPMTLRFERAGSVVVPFAVAARIDAEPAMAMHH